MMGLDDFKVNGEVMKVTKMKKGHPGLRVNGCEVVKKKSFSQRFLLPLREEVMEKAIGMVSRLFRRNLQKGSQFKSIESCQSGIFFVALILLLLGRIEAGEAPLLDMTVDNQRSEIVEIFWIGPGQKEVSYGLIGPETNFIFRTYASHQWVIRSQEGKWIRSFTMPSHAETLTIHQSPERNGDGSFHLPSRFPYRVCLGFPKSKDRLPTLGKVQVAVLFVDYPDAQASERPESFYTNLSPKAEAFFTAVSYGAMTLQFQPHFKWLRLKELSTAFNQKIISGDGHRQFIQAAIDEVPNTFHWQEIDSVVVLSPLTAKLSSGPAFIGSESWGLRGGEKNIKSAQTSGQDFAFWDGLWFPHECGHTMSLPDLYALPWDSKTNYEYNQRYAGGFSLMGYVKGKSPEYFGFERWQLGWIQDDQVWIAKEKKGTYTIHAIEMAKGKKMIFVPLGKTRALIVESRRALGFDKNISKPGALIYWVDTAVASGKGPIIVQAKDMDEPYKDHAPLAKGESLSCFGVTVSCIAADAESDTLVVETNP